MSAALYGLVWTGFPLFLQEWGRAHENPPARGAKLAKWSVPADPVANSYLNTRRLRLSASLQRAHGGFALVPRPHKASDEDCKNAGGVSGTSWPRHVLPSLLPIIPRWPRRSNACLCSLHPP
ncbi:hypothetical protein V8C35DRAFT_210851 [Trichoderma chlorosporum]